MKKLLLSILIIVFVQAGCSNLNSENKIERPKELIEVTILVPESIIPGNEIKISAHVTQGNEDVEDANEVKFEVWKSGQDEHEMHNGKHEGAGMYSVNKTFSEEGKYNVVAHVTARNMHNMPKKEVIVGNAQVSDVKEHENENINGEHAHDEKTEEGHHDHGHSDISIELKSNDTIIANKETMIHTTIMYKRETLTDATITFEIYKKEHEDHVFIDAIENKGEYMSKYTFLTPGQYQVNVHVKKDEIHEHKVFTVNVK